MSWTRWLRLGDFSEMLLPSEFAKPSPALLDLAKSWMCAAATIRWCCCAS